MTIKQKLADLKTKLKEHAPEIVVVVTGMAGAVGWALAGMYKTELDNGIMIPFGHQGKSTKENWKKGTLIDLFSEDANYTYVVQSKKHHTGVSSEDEVATETDNTDTEN